MESTATRYWIDFDDSVQPPQSSEVHKRMGSAEQQRRRKIKDRAKEKLRTVESIFEECVQEYNKNTLDINNVFRKLNFNMDLNFPGLVDTVIENRFPYTPSKYTTILHQRRDYGCKLEHPFILLLKSNRFPTIFKEGFISRLKQQLRDDEIDLRGARHRINKHFNTINKVKEQLVALDELGDIPTSIYMMSSLIPSVSFSNYRLSWGTPMGKLHLNVSYEEDHGAELVKVPGHGTRVIEATRYRINFTYNSGKYQFSEVLASKISGTSRINPHANGGMGGGVCLGGFSYAVAQCAESRDWGQLAYTLQEFHTTVDPRDAWGKAIRYNERVLVDKGTGENLMEWDNSFYLRKPSDLHGEMYYQKGHTIYDQKNYVKCAATGNIIKRENAIRVPTYYSEAGMRQLSKKNTYLNRELKGRLSLFDYNRVMEQADAIWKKYHRKNMCKYYYEAQAFVWRKTRAYIRSLTEDRF